MPYPGVPSHLTKKMERCVADVMKGGKSKSSAVAICKSRIVGKKDYSLTERAGLVEYAWSELRVPGWLAHVYDDYAIVRVAGKYFRIGYQMVEGGNIEFSDEISQVEQTWVPAKAKDIALPSAYNIIRPVPEGDLTTAIPNAPIRATDGGRYKAYAVVFGDPDSKDLYGQYFDAKTEYFLDWYKTRPWLYHHGINPMMGAGKIGEWDSIGVDDVGVFLEGERLQSHKYHEAVDALLEEELLFPSSGALSYLVRVDDDGHVAQWPIAEVSSTVAPAEFRMRPITDTAVRAFDTIYGGQDMKLKEFLEALKSATTSETSDDEEVVEGANEDEVDEEAESDEEVDVEEVVAAMSAAMGFEEFVNAVKSIDTLAHEMDDRLKTVEQAVGKLTAQETQRMKSYAVGDWAKDLYSVTRSAEGEEVDDNDAEMVPSGTADGTPDVFSGIFGQG